MRNKVYGELYFVLHDNSLLDIAEFLWSNLKYL